MSIATAFLSHSSKDKPLVEEVANALCQRGIVPLFDKNDLNHSEMDFVEDVNAAISESSVSESKAEPLADTIAQRVYTLMNVKNTHDINIVIDQRGKGSRREPYTFPPTVANLAAHPTLVFRPDLGERSFSETLTGEKWTAFRQNIEHSLSKALGSLHSKMNIHILGNAQLGFPFFLGQYFDRLTFVKLHCYHAGIGNLFSNEEWKALHGGKVSHHRILREVTLSKQEKQRLRERLCKLEDNRKIFSKKLARLEKAKIIETDVATKFKFEQELADTTAENTTLEQEMSKLEAQLASGKEMQTIPPGEHHETVALYVGFGPASDDASDYITTKFPSLPFVPVIVGDFNTSDDVKHVVQEVLEYVQCLRKYNKTTAIHLYCALPFNVVPLLAANLVNIQVTVNYMEFRKDLKEQEQGCSPSELYEFLPMK